MHQVMAGMLQSSKFFLTCISKSGINVCDIFHLHMDAVVEELVHDVLLDIGNLQGGIIPQQVPYKYPNPFWCQKCCDNGASEPDTPDECR
jgi:hypothetical protein